ncbi:MAG: ABC transporter permease [Bacteroidales bacterium]|nr:ABC transporter permease [Bacteroidales bacterium]
MKLEPFIARRIFFSREGDNRASKPAVIVATAGIALGLAVMILSVAIVTGFKKEVREIVTGFSSHIQISNYDNNFSYETQPIRVSDSLCTVLNKNREVKHLQVYATKPGIIKTDQDFQGIVVKGVGTDYNWDFFRKSLREGELLTFSDSAATNDVMISENLSSKLGIKLGDSFLAYFIQSDIRVRKFKVKGIFNTNFVEFDRLFLIADIRHIQRLNQWEPDQVSGLEVQLHDFDQVDVAWDSIYGKIANRSDDDGNFYYPRSIKMIMPQVLDWLDMLDINMWAILALLLAVSGFTMISGLLIIILERINMIGILKALGASDLRVRGVFLHLSLYLIGRGMLLGNLLGVGLCLLQKYSGLVKLDPSTYYLSAVPVHITLLQVLLINIGTMVITVLLMIAPSFLITRIPPSKVMRFE